MQKIRLHIKHIKHVYLLDRVCVPMSQTLLLLCFAEARNQKQLHPVLEQLLIYYIC